MISYVRDLCAKWTNAYLRKTSYGFKSAALNMRKALWGSAKYAQSTLEPELKRISGKRARANEGSSDQLLQEHAKYLRESRYLACPPVEDSYDIARVCQDLQARNLPLYARKSEGGSIEPQIDHRLSMLFRANLSLTISASNSLESRTESATLTLMALYWSRSLFRFASRLCYLFKIPRWCMRN